VSLLELQGRAVARDGQTPGQLRDAAVTKLFRFPLREQGTDEAEVTIAALDMTEISSAILRTIERIVQERRTLIAAGTETLAIIRRTQSAVAVRLVALDGKLEEARHDVSVGRSLRREEQARVNALNARRDAVIQSQVKFLAYVRPRFFEIARRSLQYWMLDSVEKPVPVPACLRQHDEPVEPLRAYLQLLRDAPARWFSALQPMLPKLDTANKLLEVLDAARSFARRSVAPAAEMTAITITEAVQFTLSGAQTLIGSLRVKSTGVQVEGRQAVPWTDLLREVEQHAVITDLIRGRHGVDTVSVAAAREVEQIGEVATCLHAEFAAIAPAVRLLWIERFSQFDRPASFRDLMILPGYGRLDRETRRTLQVLVDWLYSRIRSSEADAVNFMNDLVRLCLLLASYAPVNRIIAGKIPAPTPVRPGILIPLKPIRPDLVRVGMEFQVWQAATIVAKGRVEDLQGGDATARVEQVTTQTATLDTSMRVQFVPAAFVLK
jgi:hypothetical protein